MKTGKKAADKGGGAFAGHPKYWVSGEAAKKFRRGLAGSAGAGGDVTQTHKFPLVAEAPDARAREDLRREYRLSSAREENTLFHYFAVFHLAGFRVFTSKNAAAVYKNAALKGGAFDKALTENFGLPENSAMVLLNELGKGIRTGKTEEKTAAKLKSALRVKAEESPAAEFLNAVAAEIADKELWGAQKAHASARRNAVVNAAKKSGVSLELPALSPYDFCVLHDGARDYLRGVRCADLDLEFAFHRLVSLAAHTARRDGAEDVKEKDIKEVLLSDNENYNGLDWLFNPATGMALFAKTPEEIKAKELDIGGCSGEGLKTLRGIAGGLIAAGYQYKSHRSLFGGNIASGVTNYWKRLKDLEENLNKIDCKAAPDIGRILRENEGAAEIVIDEFERIALPLEQLQELINRLIQDKENAGGALRRLTGGGDKIAGKSEVEAVEKFNDDFLEVKGLFIQLAEKLRRSKDAQKGDFAAARKLFPSLEFLLPPKRKSGDDADDDAGADLKLQKINRYAGAQVFDEAQINEKLAEDYERLRQIRAARRGHWREIAPRYSVDIIGVHTEAEEKAEKQRADKSAEGEIRARACRRVLQRLAGTVRNLGGDRFRGAGIRLFESAGVFAESDECRAFFAAGAGRLYVSPYARYRHEPLTLGKAFRGDMRGATEKFIARFFDWADGADEAAETAQERRDAALLEQTVYALRCGGIRKDVPSALAALRDESLELPVSLRQALQQEEVSGGVLARLFNAYASEINGLCARLARERVIAKSRLQHIGDKSFYYALKAGKDWKLPRHLFDESGGIKGDSPLAAGARILREHKMLADGCAEIKAAALPAAVKCLHAVCGDGGKDIFCHCLRQIPHDWYYRNGEYPALTPRADDAKHPCLLDDKREKFAADALWRVEKGAIKPEAKNQSSAEYLRLSGTSRHKGWMDAALLGRATWGDSALIMEEEYRLCYDGKTGELKARYDKTRLEIAAVFKFAAAAKAAENKSPLEDNFIAVDLGERGIGYAVYAMPAAGNDGALPAPAECGHVVLPILRRLMRKVDFHRRQTQPRQRFQSNLNPALQHMREAAIGELAGVIDGLMKKHRAFPVFESSVGGFESGGRMLKMVYGSILQLYIFSDIDAHKTKRQNHWQSAKAPMWKHSRLEDKRKGKPLSMFPGVAVHPAGTSQTCAHTGENPLTLIDESAGPYKSDGRGILTLALKDGRKAELYIYKKPKNPESRDKDGDAGRKKAENPLPSLARVWKERAFKNRDELKKHVKDMLRHRPPSRASKDTSQSSYLSPFVKTQAALRGLSDDELKQRHCFRRNGLIFMHADVNAAVNIGAKWWRDVIRGEAKKRGGKA